MCINDKYSQPQNLTFSVPQGSTSGANLFVAYCQSLCHDIPPGVSLQGFADDHFAHRSIKTYHTADYQLAIEALESTMLNTKQWMDSMRLKLNPDKTEFVIFGNKKQLAKISCDSINVIDSAVQRSNSVKCLGTLMDSNLNFKSHVVHKCQIAMLNLKQIRSIRDVLTKESCEILVNGLVLFHLDYNNAVLIGLPQITINMLQRIQNIAAKLVLRRKHSDSSTEVLKELHWLPIFLKIKFKTACLVHKCTYGSAPLYLKDLLVLIKPDNIKELSMLCHSPERRHLRTDPLVLLDHRYGTKSQTTLELLVIMIILRKCKNLFI